MTQLVTAVSEHDPANQGKTGDAPVKVMSGQFPVNKDKYAMLVFNHFKCSKTWPLTCIHRSNQCRKSSTTFQRTSALYTYTHTHTHTHTHTYIYIYIYICVCVCIRYI